jgi:capsular polysaccharide biosynthesis protein
MTENPQAPGRTRPLDVFIIVFMSVFLLILLIVFVFTNLQAETFTSAARIKVERRLSKATAENSPERVSSRYDLIRTEVEVLQSELILGKVIWELALNITWGKRYNADIPLKTGETLQILTSRLDVRPVPDTSIIEIRVYGDSSDEPAKIANAIASAYADEIGSSTDHLRVQLIDSARPGLEPIHPNKLLNITMGVVVGIIIGVGCATFCAWLTISHKRKMQQRLTAQ